MADPHRSESKGPADASRTGEREAPIAAQIETLLVEGLDRYFAHQYEEAIHVWTRVLFLDRTHARAHAYIDRARTALAERHRRGQEMLQATQDLLDRGAVDAARSMLRQAVAHGADDEGAAALWLKLERRARTRATASIGQDPVHDRASSAPRWSLSSRMTSAILILASVTAIGVLADLISRAWSTPNPPSGPVAAAADHAAPTLLSSAEVALIRARTLYARGQLAEALQALDRVPSTAPNRPEADALRRQIQRLLLATAQPHERQAPRPDSLPL